MYPVDCHAEPKLCSTRRDSRKLCHQERVRRDKRDCPPRQPRRKIVSFADADAFEPSSSVPSIDKRHDLYWSKHERRQFVSSAQREAQRLRVRARVHQASVQHARDNCQTTKLPSPADQATDMQALVLWADSPGRGLERTLLPCWRRDLHETVQQIVGHYQYLRSKAAADQRINVSDALRVFSERRSFQSREFAMKMAAADSSAL
jgi:hypothetical protein